MTGNMLIDPIYEKFTRGVMRAIGSSEFYEFFMDSIAKADNEFQFSNRKMEKYIDTKWIDAVEESLEGFQNIIENPRNTIREDELIVNVANAKKAGSDVVRHLAQHGSLVESFDQETGNVRPAKLMQKYREDSTVLYENRLAYTTLENAYHFVQLRYNALTEAMSDEFGAKLKVKSNMESATELMHVDMYLHIKKKDNLLETDEKNRETFERIARLNRLLGTFMNTPFAEQFAKLTRVKGNVMRTNVLKKNPDYKKVVKLFEFLRQYDDVGYVIQVTEQNPQIDEKFRQDIYHNILFQYLILKGYLDDESDRQVPEPLKKRKRKLKPKVIRQIIDELTEDYDLPDVEIRKVFIDELTKAQILEEEQEKQRKLEEAKAAARESIEQKEREEAEKIERIQQEMEDRRRGLIFKAELEWFELHKAERLDQRLTEQRDREAKEKEKYAKENAVKIRFEKELEYFKLTIPVNAEARIAYEEQVSQEQEARLMERQQRREQQLREQQKPEGFRAFAMKWIKKGD
jgi:hypothetical protein